MARIKRMRCAARKDIKNAAPNTAGGDKDTTSNALDDAGEILVCCLELLKRF